MGMRWVGKLELEFGSGGGAGNGGASRSWSAMVLRESGLHPCIRSLAWRTCEVDGGASGSGEAEGEVEELVEVALGRKRD